MVLSLHHKSFEEYRNAVAPHLDEVIGSRRDPECEFALAHAFLLFSFTIEDLKEKATTNAKILDDVAITFIEMQDVLRGIVHGVTILSPATLAALLRIAFEIRCNLKFIYSSLSPSVYADRYRRFRSASILYNEQANHPGQPMLTPERRQELLRESDEWIRSVTPDGRFEFSTNWTAERELKSLKKRAARAGLEPQYEGSYAVTSQFVHGTALAAQGYLGGDGTINAIGQTETCRRFAVLGAMNCLHAALEGVRFFGWPFDAPEFDRCIDRVKACSQFRPGEA